MAETSSSSRGAGRLCWHLKREAMMLGVLWVLCFMCQSVCVSCPSLCVCFFSYLMYRAFVSVVVVGVTFTYDR